MKLDRISSSAHLKQRLGWRHPPLCSWSTHLEDQFCIFPTTTIIWPRSPAQLSRQLVFWKFSSLIFLNCTFLSFVTFGVFYLGALLTIRATGDIRKDSNSLNFWQGIVGGDTSISSCVKYLLKVIKKKLRFMHFRIFQGERTKKGKPEKIWLLLFRNDIGRWTESLIDLRLYEEIILWRLLLTSSFTLPLSCGDFRSLWIFILLQKLKMLCSANISPDAKSLVMSVCFAK